MFDCPCRRAKGASIRERIGRGVQHAYDHSPPPRGRDRVRNFHWHRERKAKGIFAILVRYTPRRNMQPYLSLLLLGALLSPPARPKNGRAQIAPAPGGNADSGRSRSEPGALGNFSGYRSAAPQSTSSMTVSISTRRRMPNCSPRRRHMPCCPAASPLPPRFPAVLRSAAAERLTGDITIFGVGDPNISARTVPFGTKTERTGPPLAALEDMADQIVRAGVRSVSGDIVGDDTWFVLRALWRRLELG